MKKITLTQGDVDYEVGDGIGAWAKSRESRVVLGDVRVIGGILMSAWATYDRMVGKEVWWAPVDGAYNTYENLRAWRLK